MKKILTKLLISVVMLIILLAPVVPSVKTDGGYLVVGVEKSTANAQATFNDECEGTFNLPCGLVKALYYIVFEPLSWLAGLAGQVLDFFIFYSTNSSSYSNEFVGKAWGAVRDIANVFFIIALLYVAIQTILGLGHGGKKMIASIIIVALLINFSLFLTQVIIDGTNILARVFYNNIDAKTADNGQKSLSAGIVAGFNPQTIFEDGGITNINDDLGTFALVTLLSAAMSAFMIFMFLSVALLFVARVVSLWLSMIFAPIAFASYTVPFDIPGFGHKEWWTNLLKNAFLAPIFIFLLYIIYLFIKGFSVITANLQSIDGISANTIKFMGVIIPFAIIFILLQKAKEMAVKYSGEMGAAINKIGAVAGGLALGAATGGVAMAGRATLGRAGSAIAKSGWAKNSAFGRAVGGVAGKLGAGSMDLRGIKVAGKSLSDTGLTGLGKAQEGGFAKMRADKVEKRQKRAQELKVSEDEPLKQALNKTEGDLQGLLVANVAEIETMDKLIEKKRQEVNDASSKFNAAKGTGGEAAARRVLNTANTELDTAKTNKTNFRTGLAYTNSTGGTSTVGGNIDALEKQKVADTQAINTENAERLGKFAKAVGSKRNNVLNFITSGGQHSSAGADEAAHKIKMDVKLDSGTKT